MGSLCYSSGGVRNMAEQQDILRDDAVKSRVKWFNVPKGFGFVEPEDGNYDAFLHVTTLKRAGVDRLGEGAWLLCRIERGAKGAQVREVVRILETGERPEPLEPPSVPETPGDDCFYLTGTVKWYSPEKGFGFVLADDGLKDVFIHKTCLARCGLPMIEPGVSVQMNVRTTPKGREVVDIQFLHEQDYFSENDDGADDAAGNS
jgi:CspA family cold shock protein